MLTVCVFARGGRIDCVVALTATLCVACVRSGDKAINHFILMALLPARLPTDRPRVLVFTRARTHSHSRPVVSMQVIRRPSSFFLSGTRTMWHSLVRVPKGRGSYCQRGDVMLAVVITIVARRRPLITSLGRFLCPPQLLACQPSGIVAQHSSTC